MTFLFKISFVCMTNNVKCILPNTFKKIFKLCFVFIQEVQITVLTFFPFFWDTKLAHQEPWYHCLDGIIHCNIPTCLWEFSLIYTVTSVQFFVEVKNQQGKKKSQVWQPLFKRNCCKHNRVSFSLIVWTIAGQILRVQFSLSPKPFNLCQCFENFRFWTIVL